MKKYEDFDMPVLALVGLPHFGGQSDKGQFKFDWTLIVQESGNCQGPRRKGQLGKNQAGGNSPRPGEL